MNEVFIMKVPCVDVIPRCVNQCIRSVGCAPVGSLDNEYFPSWSETQTAINTIRKDGKDDQHMRKSTKLDVRQYRQSCLQPKIQCQIRVIQLPSSIWTFFSNQKRAYTRRNRHIVAITMQAVVTPQARLFWLGGFSKSGVTPAGGVRAGSASSALRDVGDIVK
jgi:hypothetical protein